VDDSKGNAKRKVLVVEDNEPNKKSCPHAMKGDGRSAATPIGRLLNASSEPGSPTLDAKLHLSNGVDASAHGPITPANRDPHHPESQDCTLYRETMRDTKLKA
jgi:hypothetical protein